MPEERAATADCRIRAPLIDGFRGPLSADERAHSDRRSRNRRAVSGDACLFCTSRLIDLAAIFSPAEIRHTLRRASRLLPHLSTMTTFALTAESAPLLVPRFSAAPPRRQSSIPSGLRFALCSMVAIMTTLKRLVCADRVPTVAGELTQMFRIMWIRCVIQRAMEEPSEKSLLMPTVAQYACSQMIRSTNCPP